LSRSKDEQFHLMYLGYKVLMKYIHWYVIIMGTMFWNKYIYRFIFLEITVFNKILSMIIIGIDYFPLFAALGLESVTGHIIGTAFSWMLLSIQIFRVVECDLVVVSCSVRYILANDDIYIMTFTNVLMSSTVSTNTEALKGLQ
jgi:hypothetical protein